MDENNVMDNNLGLFPEEDDPIEAPKIKVLFICHGNICRSPMAEFYFRHRANRRGYGAALEVASAGVSDEEQGNPVYPLAKRMLASHGIGCRNKTACQVTREMCDTFDYLVVMDGHNRDSMLRAFGGGVEEKLSLLLDFVNEIRTDYYGRDVADPWYTRNFERAWDDIVVGCDALLDYIIETHHLTPVEND